MLYLFILDVFIYSRMRVSHCWCLKNIIARDSSCQESIGQSDTRSCHVGTAMAAEEPAPRNKDTLPYARPSECVNRTRLRGAWWWELNNFLGEVCFVSIDFWDLRCAGIGDDLRVCTWWYGGETLSLGICTMFEQAEDTISMLLPS